MVARYAESKAAQIMVEAIPDDLVDQYGIVDVTRIPDVGESIAIQDIIEKPPIGSALQISLWLVVTYYQQKLCTF